jgi:hypothetical protein
MNFTKSDMDHLNSSSYTIPASTLAGTSGTTIINPAVTATMTQAEMAAMGGKARQASMTKKEKSKLAVKAAKSRWEKPTK